MRVEFVDSGENHAVTACWINPRRRGQEISARLLGSIIHHIEGEWGMLEENPPQRCGVFQWLRSRGWILIRPLSFTWEAEVGAGSVEGRGREEAEMGAERRRPL